MDGAPFVEMRLDGFGRRLLVVLTGLLAVITVELFALRSGGPSPAAAQIPDTGLQRKQIVDETRQTNELLQRILDHLEHNTIKVRLERSDKPMPAGEPGRRQGGNKARPISP